MWMCVCERSSKYIYACPALVILILLWRSPPIFSHIHSVWNLGIRKGPHKRGHSSPPRGSIFAQFGLKCRVDPYLKFSKHICALLTNTLKVNKEITKYFSALFVEYIYDIHYNNNQIVLRIWTEQSCITSIRLWAIEDSVHTEE